jgi:uncharacterized protein (DUF362 family)
MKRRQFLQAAGGAAIGLASGSKGFAKIADMARLSAMPCVGIVASNFAGSRDGDGVRITGLADPRPVSADLTKAQIDAMVRKVLEIGDASDSGLANRVQPTDWVVIKPNIVHCPGVSEVMQVNFVPGMVADPRVVRCLIEYLAERQLGRRITIAEASGGWKCLEHSQENIVGGCFGVEGDDQLNVRHNVVVAGRNAVAVDAAAAAMMGFAPAEMLFLQNASKNGFGTYDLEHVRTQGSSLEEARRRFKSDTSWRPVVGRSM